MTPRLALERELVSYLLNAPSVPLLARWRRGLAGLGISPATFSGSLARIYAAIATLSDRGEGLSVDAIVRESRGRVGAGDVEWLAVAYRSDTPLYELAVQLVDADRRSKADSIFSVALNGVRAPSADVDRVMATAIAALRRLRRAA